VARKRGPKKHVPAPTFPAQPMLVPNASSSQEEPKIRHAIAS
jgi:hypothetical protein